MKKLLTVIIVILVLLGIVYFVKPELLQNLAPEKAYTADSWKTIIDPSCQHFFDGCNTCNKVEGETEMAACTRMYCETYQKPECRDNEDVE